MKPEKKAPELSETGKKAFDEINKRLSFLPNQEANLESLVFNVKQDLDLSNKKWDKAKKELVRNGLIEIDASDKENIKIRLSK
jgi:hypothetical protein